jgi:citrate lyase synthetase
MCGILAKGGINREIVNCVIVNRFKKSETEFTKLETELVEVHPMVSDNIAYFCPMASFNC